MEKFPDKENSMIENALKDTRNIKEASELLSVSQLPPRPAAVPQSSPPPQPSSPPPHPSQLLQAPSNTDEDEVSTENASGISSPGREEAAKVISSKKSGQQAAAEEATARRKEKKEQKKKQQQQKQKRLQATNTNSGR